MYQLIIVGGGPGGLTAGLYAARASLDVLLVDKAAVGGQVLLTDWIENYPGFPQGVSGFALADKMSAQANRFDLPQILGQVASMNLYGEVKSVLMADGKTLKARAVIIATGARPNKLNVPGEEEFAGKGVSYCATCDGPFYRNMRVAVVGGGDTAVQEAVYLTKFAKKVTIIHRRDELRATPIIQETAFRHKRVDFICDAEVIGIDGQKEVGGLRLRYQDGQEESRPFQGVFILIGVTPNNETLTGTQLEMRDGFVVTNCMMQSNIPGVMAIGDIRADSIRQVISAAGDGAVAEKAAEMYLEHLHNNTQAVTQHRKCTCR
ncbi:MAG: FAD-dependent oxidoreductase [Deltaproteobacteria bacterium]|nr:FAD-dependent oxidoreductase [Deltaproteobacteria bacterium]